MYDDAPTNRCALFFPSLATLFESVSHSAMQEADTLASARFSAERPLEIYLETAALIETIATSVDRIRAAVATPECDPHVRAQLLEEVKCREQFITWLRGRDQEYTYVALYPKARYAAAN